MKTWLNVSTHRPFVTNCALIFASSAFIFATSTSRAAGKTLTPTELDDELIAGSRRASTLFLKLESNTIALGSIIYNRNDFNDYHELDSRRRLKSITARTTKGSSSRETSD